MNGNKDKRIGCVVQDILSTLISPSLLEQESFLKVSMKQNANNWCRASLVDAQWTYKDKGTTRRYPVQGMQEALPRDKVRQGKDRVWKKHQDGIGSYMQSCSTWNIDMLISQAKSRCPALTHFLRRGTAPLQLAPFGFAMKKHT